MHDYADHASDIMLLFPDADLRHRDIETAFDLSGWLHEADTDLALLLDAPEQPPGPVATQTAVRASYLIAECSVGDNKRPCRL